MFKKVLIPIFICLFMVTWVNAAERQGTPAEAKELVLKAVAFVKANGEEKALKEFNNPKGKFVKGDLYLFVFDPKCISKASVNLPEHVGTYLCDKPDSTGKLHRKEIVDVGNKLGSGWVTYHQRNPLTKKDQAKVSYIQKEGNLIIGCGAYLP